MVNPRIVRGLDYYTRTVFEFVSSALGAQSTVCGGGRYDGLVEELGGPPTPGVGFGLGLERFLMVVEKLAGEHAPPRRGIQAIALGEAARERLIPIVGALRERSAEPTFADWQARKLTAHFKTADRNNARWALILGDEELAAGEIVLRDLLAREDRRLPLAGRRGGGRAPPRRSHGVMEQDEAARVRALGEIAAEFDLDAIRVRTGDTEIEIVRRDPAVHAAAAGRLRARAPAAAPRGAPAPAGAAAPAAAGRGRQRAQGDRAGRRRVLPRARRRAPTRSSRSAAASRPARRCASSKR